MTHATWIVESWKWNTCLHGWKAFVVFNCCVSVLGKEFFFSFVNLFSFRWSYSHCILVAEKMVWRMRAQWSSQILKFSIPLNSQCWKILWQRDRRRNCNDWGKNAAKWQEEKIATELQQEFWKLTGREWKLRLPSIANSSFIFCNCSKHIIFATCHCNVHKYQSIDVKYAIWFSLLFHTRFFPALCVW